MSRTSNGRDALHHGAAPNIPPPSASNSLSSLPHHRHHTGEKSALVMRLLRQKVRATRTKKPKEFYSIREVAGHFAVPLTTVSRIYTQLKAEGLLTTVWGSKTFIAPTGIDKHLRVRGVVALPAALGSFCVVRQYRNFLSEICDALWKFGFTTKLLFYEENETDAPMFAERLLKHRVDIVIWFLPSPKSKQTVARLLDRGIGVTTVTDLPEDCPGHGYCVDRGPAIRAALLSWKKHGVTSVTVVQTSRSRFPGALTLLQKCLLDAAMPYSFANAESLHFEDLPALRAQQVMSGTIFPSWDMTFPFAMRDPAFFAKLSKRSRVLLIDGAIDIPGSYPISGSIDIVDIDARPIATRIVSDLIQSARPRKTEPLMFQAKWIPAPLEDYRHFVASPAHR